MAVMRHFVDQVVWLKENTEIMDFLLKRDLDQHVKFMYGSRMSETDGTELYFYQTLLDNINKILFSENDYWWHPYHGIMSDGVPNAIPLCDEEDIKELYMTIL